MNRKLVCNECKHCVHYKVNVCLGVVKHKDCSIVKAEKRAKKSMKSTFFRRYKMNKILYNGAKAFFKTIKQYIIQYLFSINNLRDDKK